jgi:hypothetical protein
VSVCLLQRVTEGKIQGGIEVTGRQGRRRRKLLDDLKERRRYCNLKEEALDRTMWRARFGGGFGSVVRQTTKWMRRNWVHLFESRYICIFVYLFTFVYSVYLDGINGPSLMEQCCSPVGRKWVLTQEEWKQTTMDNTNVYLWKQKVRFFSGINRISSFYLDTTMEMKNASFLQLLKT